VGKISKQWSGLLREAFTDADYFGITFPMDLDVKMKAVMIGACFLIVSTVAQLQIHMLCFVIVSTLQKYKFCEHCWRIVMSVSV
jgi:Scramblase.